MRIPAALNGDPLPKLEPASLRARINGVESTVLNVKGPGDDLVMLLVFDVTGDLALIDPAKQAIFEKLNTLPKNVYVGVMRAGNGLEAVSDPSPDRAATASAIANLAVSPKSAMLDTVVEAAEIGDAMSLRSGVRTAVVYITDSDVGNYREDFTNPVINWSDSRDLSRRFPEGLIREKTTKLEETLGGIRAPVFFVHLEYRTDRLNEAYQSGLLRIAAATGGSGIFCRAVTEIPETTVKVMNAALDEYLVSLQLPPKVSKNASVEIRTEGRVLVYPVRVLLRPGS